VRSQRTCLPDASKFFQKDAGREEQTSARLSGKASVPIPKSASRTRGWNDADSEPPHECPDSEVRIILRQLICELRYRRTL